MIDFAFSENNEIITKNSIMLGRIDLNRNDRYRGLKVKLRPEEEKRQKMITKVMSEYAHALLHENHVRKEISFYHEQVLDMSIMNYFVYGDYQSDLKELNEHILLNIEKLKTLVENTDVAWKNFKEYCNFAGED